RARRRGIVGDTVAVAAAPAGCWRTLRRVARVPAVAKTRSGVFLSVRHRARSRIVRAARSLCGIARRRQAAARDLARNESAARRRGFVAEQLTRRPRTQTGALSASRARVLD